MEILTNALKERLEAEKYCQAELCRTLNINRYSFNRAINTGVMGLKMMGKIYNYLGEDFDLIEDLTPIVADRMDRYTYKELPSILGISYSSARNFVNNGLGNRNVVTALFENDKECHDIIIKYCL